MSDERDAGLENARARAMEIRALYENLELQLNGRVWSDITAAYDETMDRIEAGIAPRA